MNSAKILIVDDAQQVRRVLRTALSAEGYTIFEAGTGEEALNLFRTSPPDAVLLDVNMPGMSGLETCQEIRRHSDVPIVMLTVRNAERDKVLALIAGSAAAAWGACEAGKLRIQGVERGFREQAGERARQRSTSDAEGI